MERDNLKNKCIEGKRVSAHLEDLKYRQLQKLAKTLNLPSNMKKQYLLEIIQAKNAGNTQEIDEIIMRSKMEKMGGKPIKEKDKKKYKLLVTDLLSSNDNKMLAIKARPNLISQQLDQSQVVVRYKENSPNTIRTRAKSDSLLCSASSYNQSDEIDSTMDGNNNEYLSEKNTIHYLDYTRQDTNSTRDLNYNMREVTSEKRPERVLKSLLLAPDSTANEYNELDKKGIGEMTLMTQPCDLPTGFHAPVNHPKKQIPLNRKSLEKAPSLLCNKNAFASHQKNLVRGTIKYIPLRNKCVQTIRYIQKITNLTEQSGKTTVPEKKVYQDSDYSVENILNSAENSVLDYDSVARNVTTPVYTCQNSPSSSLEMQRDNSDYFIQEIGNTDLLNCTNAPFSLDSGITSDILIDSIENNDINLMADNFLLKHLVEVVSVNTQEENSKMENENGEIDVSNDLSHLLPYMAGFDRFTDPDDIINRLGTANDKINADKNDNNENLSCLESLFSISTEQLLQTSNDETPDETVSHTVVCDSNTVCTDDLVTIPFDETALFDHNSSELGPTTTNVNTETFLQKAPKIMSPNFMDNNKEISFPLILGYLQGTESEMTQANASPISDVSVNTTDLDEDTLSLICHSKLLSDEAETNTSDCFYCTWRGNLSSLDHHLRQYHNNYIQPASYTGSIEHTVSLTSIRATPNQCLPVLILAYDTLVFLQVNHLGTCITASLSSIQSHSTHHQKMNGTIEIFSKDNYHTFLWTGAIHEMDGSCSYFNFNPTENCLKVRLSDIGYSDTNSEKENAMFETAENDTQFKFRIKLDCIY